MSTSKRITAHAARAVHELQLTAIVVSVAVDAAAAELRGAARWAGYGARVARAELRTFRAELARARALAGV